MDIQTRSIWIIFLLISISHFTRGNNIIINEIMVNPNNASLPAFEYIELYNNGNTIENLADLEIKINNNSLQLASYFLSPKQYVILISNEGKPAFQDYGNTISPTRWFALNNTNATLQILKNNVLLDFVAYRDTWYGNTTKKAGGWSLERISPSWSCNSSASWKASVAVIGGTPGKENSVFEETFSSNLSLSSSRILGKSLLLNFNLNNDVLHSFQPNDFYIDSENNQPNIIEWNTSGDTLKLDFTSPLELNKLYQLNIKSIHICGRSISGLNFLVFDQEEPLYNQIIINEILFNPKTGGDDFVEIYNTANKPINLQNWKIGNRTITNDQLILAPNNYLVFTINKENLIKNYPHTHIQNIKEIPTLPPYPNQQGTVTLFSSQGKLVDSLYYNAAMHSPFLNNVKGISLERQFFDKETNDAQNWKSAATIIGGGTPGYKNSSNVDNFLKKNIFSLTSKTFSPNGDNFEDFLILNYNFTSADNIINVNIFDDSGRSIKRLIRQESAGLSGQISWDGNDENNQKSAAGHYIIFLEFFDKNNVKGYHREAFVLVRN